MAIRKNCIICEGEIYRSNNCNSAKSVRRSGAITCSRQCAKIYTRVSKYIWSAVYRKEKKNKEID